MQSSTSALNFTERASLAVNESSAAYANLFLAPSAKNFTLDLLHTVTLESYLKDPPGDPSLQNFAVNYVSNQSGLSRGLVNSTFDLSKDPGNSSLSNLAGNVVWSPDKYGAGPEIKTLISSFVDPAKKTVLVSVSLNQSSNQNVLAIRSIVHSAVQKYGYSEIKSAWVTGNDALNYDSSVSTSNDLNIILPVTIILLLVATGIFFSSVLTPFVALGIIGVALAISQIFVLLVGIYINKVDFTIPTILISVLIGVGTDYSVFLLARYREERVRGLSVTDSLIKSVNWAGQSITTSGATVIIAFLSLGFSSVVYLQTMGIIVGLGVLVALLIALTLVPAIISIVGGRTFWPISGKRFDNYASRALAKSRSKNGYFAKSGAFSVKRAPALILLAFLVSIPALYIYLGTTPSYDYLSGQPANLESIQASNYLTSSFGGGRLFPSYVVVTFNQQLWNGTGFNTSDMGVLNSITSYLRSQSDVGNVTGPTTPYGQSVQYSMLSATSSQNNRTISSINSDIGKDGKTVLITANMIIDPYTTQAISDASVIRSYLHANFDHAAGITGVYLGGASGSILDTKHTVDAQFGSILPIVVVGVGIVLVVVLGSIILPLFAILSILMSIVWTLAVTKFVFQEFFNFGIPFITPLFLFVTLLGLGMDYNIFILTRIREEAGKGQSLKDSILNSIENTGGIISAAAIILAGSIGALMLSSELLLKELGFAFAFCILIDALVVRTYLVPAVMSLLGKWNWYNPTKWKRLDLNPVYQKANSKTSSN